MSYLGIELKRLRTQKGVTLEEAASHIGITRPYLSMLERGLRKSVSFEVMNQISEYYEVPLDYIKKFIHEPAKELSPEKLALWQSVSKMMEEELYEKRRDRFLKWLRSTLQMKPAETAGRK